MSHMREVSEIIELCEEQGFVVHRLQRSSAWRVMPKDRTKIPVVIYDGRSRGSSQTKYLNTRSELRRIGVAFPECEKPQQTKEAEPMVFTPPPKPIPPGPPSAPSPAPTATFAALTRVREKMDVVSLAIMDLDVAVTAAEKELGPLFEMQQLLQKLSTVRA